MNLEALLKGGISPEFDFDLVSVPANGDKMVRLRTLEEALDEFEGEFGGSADAEDLQRYLIQIKPRKERPPVTEISKPGAAGGEKRSPSSINESVYLHDGTLNIEFLMQNADLLFASGEYALARNIYAKVIQEGHSSLHTSQALLATAKCFEQDDCFDGARKSYEESIAYRPCFETYQRLASLLLHQNKAYQAAEVLERALNLKDLPNSKTNNGTNRVRFELHKAAGNSWMKACEMANAEKNYRKALEIDPGADEIQANLGALYLHAEKIQEAKRRFQDALAANARNDKALAGLGSCFLAVGDKKSAHDYFAQALGINIQNPQAIFHLVKCAYQIKSYAVAARVVEEYVQIAPININLMYSLAGLQFHLGRMNEARATAKKILELSANHTGAKDLLGMIERF